MKHGAKQRKTCGHEGCTNYARKGGVCVRHGAKEKNKTCSQTMHQPSCQGRSLYEAWSKEKDLQS